ncbi:MAG: hypothetical protein WC593_07710 [Methanoregula sp.]
MKNLTFILLIAIFVMIAGCSSDYCLTGEDKNITVSVVENKDKAINAGFTYHHNVTISIVNLLDASAKSVEVKTGYCNDFLPQQRKCENRSFNIDYIPPKGIVTQFFEYDRNVVENAADGKYQLQYRVKSCLPYIVVDNNIYASQR